MEAARVPGMSDGGGGESPQLTIAGDRAGPCSPVKVLAFYLRCHGSLVKVLNGGIAFSIFLWPWPGEELNLEQEKRRIVRTLLHFSQ